MPRFRSATVLELAFLRVITRGYPAAERQIETCLVSEWDDGYLDVRPVDGPPLELSRNPAMGPTVQTGIEDVPHLICIFWVDEGGMIASIEVSKVGTGMMSDSDRMSFFVEVDRSDPARLSYGS